MSSWLRKKIAVAQAEGATHFYAHDLYDGRDDRPCGYSPSLFMCKLVEGEWYYKALEVFGKSYGYTWFQNLESAEDKQELIEVGLKRLDEGDRKREEERTGQTIMF